ncbi:hypothetical protein P9112_014261 [Eukaryota sp. TZLM1-RC]
MSEEDQMAPDDLYYSSDDDNYIPSSYVLSGPAREELKKDILEQLDLAKSLLRERQNELSVTKTEKDDLAVQIYSRQRELGLTQSKLDDVASQIEELQQKRTEHEVLRDTAKKSLDQTTTEAQNITSSIRKLQNELDRINDSLRLASQYQDAEVDHIELMRRAAHKGEEEISEMEVVKKAQDMRLVQHQQKIQTQEETLAIVQGQIEGQKSEVEVARSILRDATNQIEQIEADKRHVLTQWKASVIGMSKRDKILSETRSEIDEEGQKLTSCQSELSSINKLISSSTDQAEKLSFELKKKHAELRSLETKLNKFKEEENKIAFQFKKVQEQLNQIEDQKGAEAKISQDLEREKSLLVKRKSQIDEGIVKTRQKINDAINETITLDRTRNHVMDDVKEVQKRIEQVENELISQENEKYRMYLDVQTVESNLHQLKTTRDEGLSQLKSLENVVHELEVAIRKRHDDIAKKQNKLQLLNHKFESLTSHVVDENLGENEAKIANLEREIRKMEEICLSLESAWLRKQTELVDLQNKEDFTRDSVKKLSAKALILTQRQVRLETHVSGLKKSINQLSRGVDSIHHRMERINHFSARLEKNRTELENEIFNTETEFTVKLGEYEAECLKIDKGIEEIKNARETLLTDIPEAEQQIQLFERMIQLQREMEATLDPAADEGVVKSMEQEIQRMKLRLKELKKRQAEATDVMVKSIQKRKFIRLKAQAGKGKSSNENVKLAKFRRQVQFSDEQINQISNDLFSLRDSESQVSTLLDELDAECKMYQDEILHLSQELTRHHDEKEQLVLRNSRLQTLKKSYDKRTSGSRPPSSKSVSSRPTSAMSVSSNVSAGGVKLEDLVDHHGALVELLDNIYDKVDVDSDAFKALRRLRNLANSCSGLC